VWPRINVAVDYEKILQGRITNHDGKPRAGVNVEATRTSPSGLTDHWYWHRAITDAGGQYVIRGLRKYPDLTIGVEGDVKSGQLPCAATVKDTPGYEPPNLDAESARGLIVKDTLTNKQPSRSKRCTKKSFR
jgi:hypothetical protein